MRTVVAITIFCLLNGRVGADDSSTQAKQLYSQGLTAYNLGHYEQALAAFEQGYTIKQDPAFLFNLGQCQRQLRRYEDAERSYRAYLRESSDLSDATREQVRKLIAEMRKAIDDQRAAMPPPGMRPPAASESRLAAEPSPVTQAQSASFERPRNRKWIWGVVAGAAVLVAGGVVLGVVLGTRDTTRTLSDFRPAP